MKFRIACLGALIVLSAPTLALAQTGCSGQPNSGYVCGNGQATGGLPGFYPQATLLDRGFGSGTGTVLNRSVSGWAATVAPALGVNGGTGGSIVLNGATSGSATFSVPAAAGSVLFQLPSTNGSNNGVLSTDGSGHLSWVNLTGTGTVTSVGLAMPGIFTVSGSPVTVSGTLTAALATQAANTVWAGPTTGAATAPTFRALVGADLPAPGLSSLGGVQANNPISHQWINAINTSGVPQLSQPSFSDISGSIAPAQCPASGLATLGCVNAINASASQWLRALSTSGIFTASQPNFSDLAGNASLAQLPGIGNNTVLANNSGGTATPLALTASNVLDMVGTTQGSVLYRGASNWTVLTPGSSGQVLSSGGPAANPTWATISGTGTVTSISAGAGITLSPSPITTTGSVTLSPINNGTVLANVSGISATPTGTTPSAVLDVIGSTQGQVLYRGASNWSALATGTSGQFLQTQGAGSTPQWASAASSVNGLTGAVVVGLAPPGGRLTPSSTGSCAPVTDFAAQTAIYYSPCGGEYVPIYDGSSIQARKFTSGPTDVTGLTLNLGSNWAANTLYDVFVTMNGGSPVLCTVAWSSSVAGSSSRATALSQYGLPTNATLAATCRTTNVATISMAANQGTWVGTFLTNGSTGQYDLKFGTAAAGGGIACACIYNAYNQVLGAFNVQDNNSTWATVATSGFEVFDPAGTGSGLNNRINVVSGSTANSINVNIGVSATLPASVNGYVVAGLNGVITPWSKCTYGLGSAGGSSSATLPLSSTCKGAVLAGLNFVQALQGSSTISTSWIGNQSGLQIEGLAASWLW